MPPSIIEGVFYSPNPSREVRYVRDDRRHGNDQSRSKSWSKSRGHKSHGKSHGKKR